jgi:hypothetical protein
MIWCYSWLVCAVVGLVRFTKQSDRKQRRWCCSGDKRYSWRPLQVSVQGGCGGQWSMRMLYWDWIGLDWIRLNGNEMRYHNTYFDSVQGICKILLFTPRRGFDLEMLIIAARTKYVA